jgi:uncharacterized protein
LNRPTFFTKTNTIYRVGICQFNGISNQIVENYLCIIKDKDMTNYFIIPGLGGSGLNHWQTWFENSQQNFQRIEQNDWDKPDISEWAITVEKAIATYNLESVVLVAHSLGCLTVAEWASRYKKKIKAALLVAPPDADLLNEKLQKRIFENVPLAKFDFETILIASSNDPWASIEKAEYYATNWGSKFINIGQAGHINESSGHGKWE